MATTKFSVSAYTADGVTTDYLITWDYLDEDHLAVYVDGTPNYDPSSTYKFDLINSTTVRVTDEFDNPVPSGAEIEIRRETPILNRAVNFVDGSALLAEDLNKNSDYLLFSMQEVLDTVEAAAQDGALAAQVATEGLRDETIVLRDTTEGYKNEALAARDTTQTYLATVDANSTAANNHRIAAAASEAAAATSETNAAASEAASAASEAAAAASEAASATSEANAAASATAASTSETNAAAAATAASTSETNAAATLATVEGIYDQFDDRYLGSKATDPVTDNDGNPLTQGTLYFSTSDNFMKVYGANGWQAAGSSVNGTSRRQDFVATTGQTTFNITGGFDAGYVDVYLNGVKLVRTTDFTESGNDIVLTSGAASGDAVSVVAYGTFTLADHYDRAEADARFVNASGDTMAGNLNLPEANVTNGTVSMRLLPATNDGRGYLVATSNHGLSLGTNNIYDRLNIDNSGRVTMPYQPRAFVEYGSVSVSGGSYAELSGGSTIVNVGNIYNSSTGRYTVPVSGVYRLTMGSQGKQSANLNAGSLYYRINGGGQLGQTLFYGDAYSGGHSTHLMFLAAGDWVQVSTFGNNGVSYTHNGVRATFELVA